MSTMDAPRAPDGKKPYKYPIRFLDLTFKPSWGNRRAERLLRPEVENGNLTVHDYHLAKDFLPGWHRYSPQVGAITGASSYFYARARKWTMGQTYFLSFGLAFSGYTLGQFYRYGSCWKFISQLENPRGFERAIENIYSRMGNHGKLGIRLPVERKRGMEPMEEDTNGMQPERITPEGQDEEWIIKSMPDSDTSSPSPSTPSQNPSSQPQPPTRMSKWDQIRSANSNAATRSSWDALRQRSSPSSSKPSPPRSNTNPNLDNVEILGVYTDPDPERAVEQARFDAMLEKERMLASGSGTKTGGERNLN